MEDVNTRQQFSFSFSDLRYSPLELTPEKFPKIWQIKWNEIRWMKFEKARVHFLTDVFAAVAVAEANRFLAINSFIVRSCDFNVSSDSEWLACSRWVVSLFQVFRYWSAARSERAEKKKEKERKRERGGNPLPHPLDVFPSHISLRCPYNLNAWNRRVVCRKKI